MVYEPLHHKYRPQTFADLVGQEAISTTLINAIRQQRIAPAYLLTGPRGTGKTSSARILAKSLNCLSQPNPTESPCGHCEACKTIARGDALDVIEIDAASNTGVDNIRDLIEKAQFAPVQCRYKVYVIDECHMLSTAAFNALLKTLEEPPDRIVFVLATTDPQRVLPTIISRCQRFDFRRIPLDAMVQHLSTIAAKEKIDIVNPAITLVAQLSQGGLRDAESLLDQLSLLPPPVTPESVWDLVGAVPERDLLGLVQAIGTDQPETVIDRARNLMNRGREPLIVLQNLASFYRDLLIAKTAPQRQDMVAITDETWQDLCTLAQTLEISAILQGQQHLRSSEGQIKNTTQPRLWLEVTLMGLLPSALVPATRSPQPLSASSFVPATPVRSAPATPIAPVTVSPSSPSLSPELPPHRSSDQGVSPQITSPQTTSPQITSPSATTPAESLPPSADPVAHTDHSALWERTLARTNVASAKALFGQQAQLLTLTGKQAIVGVRPGLLQLAEGRIPPIQEALSQVLGYPVTVKLQPLSPVENPEPARLPSLSAPPSPPIASPPPETRSIPQPAPAPPQSHPIAVTPPVPPISPSPQTKSAPTPEPRVPPQPVAKPLNQIWNEDETLRAAKSLATFFNGDVIVEEEELVNPIAATIALDDPVDDDDDVPF
ncbi:MAG: DNA polymerase III subunit gamma/tau [Prochlorotrichaceae cyanobacterium]